jgi:hypothetical protein
VPKVPTVEPAEAEDDKAEGPQVERVIEMPKMHRAPVATPKRRRMASMLDAVIETTKALSPAPSKKIAEAAKAQAEAETRQAEAEAKKTQAEAEAGPSAPVAVKPVAPEEKQQGRMHLKLLLPKLQSKLWTTSFDMLRGRNCPKKKFWKPDTMRES